MEKRTDLALEAHEILTKTRNETEIPGVKVDINHKSGLTITAVNIINKTGEKALQKPVGNYITIEIPKLIDKNDDTFSLLIDTLSHELKKLINIEEDKLIMVVGLGNRYITADALGPKVVSKLLITRHLFQLMPDEIDDSLRPVCAISPGVLGITGIETGEILKGVINNVKPDLIIVIDALASRKLERVSTTIQLSDTGITPGSGIGNVRMSINKETLGVPVIAIGVPTVVDAATMANDTIDMVIDTLMERAGENNGLYNILKQLNKEEKYHLIYDILSKEYLNMVVTPKDVDKTIEDISEVISQAINNCMRKAK